ncbi:hypothetical protein DMH01_03300 [Amycolatopsis sp. WAC 04182]|uniref:altered inheritance of mitochondria protein 21 n=1 Tax=Amycolatopsis sp. WAC 04182 TaxID=2203198 RepID=UPI000F77F384|nr:altered inheritance of mitochondria protein 21 [Amycolatopsis sp. WAC 04182]RSN65417.1 hypothetical protein DMH01_03300 [Amycolatopsis sp. WAC 04182]
MALKHVRARNTVTGAVAAVSERALELGVMPDWEAVEGPVPKRPKSAVPALQKKTTGEKPEEESADGSSAGESKE